MILFAGGTGCSPRGKVTHPDASGQMRIYSPSVIAALQKHLVSADPELGGPLENLVEGGSHVLIPCQTLHFALLALIYASCVPGCPFRKSVLTLGVPGPAGLHHGGGAGGLDNGLGRPPHLSGLSGYWLVHGQPEQGSESCLGSW